MRVYELRETKGIESLILTDRPIPVPGPQQVLVRMRTVALNHSDLSVTKGTYRVTALPMVPCSDGVGEVVDLGASVRRLHNGDRVTPIFMPDWIDGPMTSAMSRRAIGRTLDGTLAEYVVADAESVVRVPAYLSDDEASTLPTAAVTAWNALLSNTTGVNSESVLTQGTGGVSLFAVQLASLMGASLISTTSSPEKAERLRQMGVTHVIDYRLTPDWEKSVRDRFKAGVDRIIEVGGAGTLERSLRAVRVGGHISLIGAVAGRGQIDPMPIVMKAIRVQGIYVGSRSMFQEMNEFISTHTLRPVIDKTFPFEQAQDAFRHLESGKHFGKVCIHFRS
jgi:NADPH:quinone reductase-like Zn-dependent oxidoreductase